VVQAVVRQPRPRLPALPAPRGDPPVTDGRRRPGPGHRSR
jgi:hypothetical protein